MSAHLIEEWPVYRQLTGADRPGRGTAIVAAARTLTGDPAGSCPSLVRMLLTGWFSIRRGEVTAGTSWPWSRSARLDAAGLGYDSAWSEVFRPGGLRLDEARPQRYSHLIFVCGPVHGEQIASPDGTFADCRRIAVGSPSSTQPILQSPGST